MKKNATLLGTKWRNWAQKRTQRNIKDRLFRFLFDKDREALLQLYNALNGTHYTDVTKLQVVTIESAVYVTMKNDLAFLIAGTLHLYEHQSTVCANMPVRFLIYLAQEFQIYIETQRESIYGEKLIPLPSPRCVVFYNGDKEVEDERILRLSDAFGNIAEKTDDSDVELKVKVLNINYGHNTELMKQCKTLAEYAEFVDITKRFATNHKNKKKALHNAIEYCIEHHILEDFLRMYRAEVLGMLLEEFDAVKYERTLREEGREQGREEGKAEGRAEEHRHLVRVVRQMYLDGKISLAEACGYLECDEKQFREEI